jgi:DNA-binding response OmpR family regulator
MSKKILIVDDSRVIRQQVTFTLSKEGYVVHLLSFEKKERFEAGQKIIGDLLKGLNNEDHTRLYERRDY